MDNKNIRFSIIFIIVIILLAIGVFVIRNKINNSKIEQEEPLFKNYKVNEYIPTHITDNDMARIYLTQYVYLLTDNREEAYNLLDEKYRNAKFPTYNSFNEYIKQFDLYNIELDRFYKNNIGKYIIFGVYDKNNNFYAFKTHGVMQYSVYLDDYTVEIGD